MAPSVKPAARLSERPFFLAVGIRRVASRVRVDSSAGDEWSREASISRVPPGVVRLRGGGCGGEQSRLLVGRGPAFGGPGRELAAAAQSRRVGRVCDDRAGPQIRRGDPPNLSISISGGKATNQDSPSNGERSGNSSSRQSLVSIASELWPAEADAPDATPSKLTWKGTSERVIAPCVAESPRAATVFGESGCLGVQPKVGGKLHLKPNSGTRPIANKYHEGKVKSTLERELKRPRNRWEGNACSRTGPRRVQGAAGSPACGRHPSGSSVRRGLSRPCTLGG